MSEGDCYQANANWVMDELTMNTNRKYLQSIKLCHGKVIGAKGTEIEGKEIFHCWIEVGDDMMFDFSNGRHIHTRLDAISHRIVQGQTKKYSCKEARRMLLATAVYGEWTDEEDEKTIGRRIARV